MNKILVAEIDNAMSEAIEWLSHIDCIIFQDDRPANEARLDLLQRALNNLRKGNTMKIVETIERECCTIADMKPYKAGFTWNNLRPVNPQFCAHCGQIYVDQTYTDEAGSPDTKRVKAIIAIRSTYVAQN